MAGGKLTGYRKMAEQVVDKVVKQLKREEEFFILNLKHMICQFLVGK